MNRWIVALLVGLAVLLLVAPGIVGRLAEQNIDRGLSQVDLQNENLSITAEAFERGWFTSEGTYRFSFDNGRLMGGVGAAEGETPNAPALILSTRLDHGPVPLGSLQRDDGSLSPALANAVSTVSMDRGDGQLVDLPARILSTVGLAGGTTARLVVEQGSDSYGNARTDWEGADLTYRVSGDGLTRSLEGNVLPFSVNFFEMDTRVGNATIDSEQDLRRHPVGEGFIDFALDSFDVRMPGEDNSSLGPVVVHLENEVSGDRLLSGEGRIELTATEVAGVGDIAFDTAFTVAGLDADGLKLIVDATRVLGMSGTVSGRDERLIALASLDQGNNQLASRGGELTIEAMNLAVYDGSATLTLNLLVDEAGDAASPTDPAGLMLRTSGDLAASISDELFEHMVSLNPDLRGLLAAGYLQKTSDGYSVAIEMDRGKLVINGAPLNLSSLLSP